MIKIIGIERARFITTMLKEAKHKIKNDPKRVKQLIKNSIELLEHEIKEIENP